MPLYEFKCSECQQISEFHLKMSESYPTECPNCGENGLSKIISPTSFKLEGGGWFNQGYDGKSNQKQEKPATKTAESASSGSEKQAPAGSTKQPSASDSSKQK